MSKTHSMATLILSGVCFLASGTFFAQNTLAQAAQTAASREDASSIDQQIAMLRSDLRSNKKQVIAANMKLTDVEAEKFWPLYEQYTADLVKINNAKYDLVKEYLQNTNLTEEQTDRLSKQWLAVDESVLQLRLRYIPIFRKVLSAKTTAMFFQLDRRVQMMIDLQLASSLPLIEP
jgi:hypothetical protein